MQAVQTLAIPTEVAVQLKQFAIVAQFATTHIFILVTGTVLAGVHLRQTGPVPAALATHESASLPLQSLLAVVQSGAMQLADAGTVGVIILSQAVHSAAVPPVLATHAPVLQLGPQVGAIQLAPVPSGIILFMHAVQVSGDPLQVIQLAIVEH